MKILKINLMTERIFPENTQTDRCQKVRYQKSYQNKTTRHKIDDKSTDRCILGELREEKIRSKESKSLNVPGSYSLVVVCGILVRNLSKISA